MTIKRLSDEQLNNYILKSIENITRGSWEGNVRSMAYSNIALIEIQLRLLDKR